MINFIVGHYECELSEQPYYEEQNQRIGESQKKARNHIRPIIGRIGSCRLQCPSGVLTEKVSTESRQNGTANYLNDKLMAFQKISDKTKTKTG